ncbi:MAG: Na+/H+ antiporter NhaC family protein [Planctomycetia bacterium]|nr:Na+/H+ antiporter NhaC family protein [Planctomycetia bacterium]
MARKLRFVLYLLIVLALGLAAYQAPLVSSGRLSALFSPTGAWSILPPIVAILLAFVTRNVVVSLMVGILSASYLLALCDHGALASVGSAFVIATRGMRDAVADPWNAGVLLQCGAIAGLVGLITASGGVRAVAEGLSKFARGPVSAQVITWFLGIFIFFDDYANVQIRGPIMRPITDLNRVSREKFSFILDSTSAPIAGIALISTWIGAEVSYISSGLTDAGLIDTISPYGLFVSSIPYRFYNIVALFFVLLTALTLREFGPMRRAELLARRGYLRELDSNLITIEEAMYSGMEGASELQGANAQEQGDSPATHVTKRGRFDALFALVPLTVLILAAFLFFYTSGQAKVAEQAIDPEWAAAYPDKMQALQPFSFATVRACFSNADASIAIFQSALLAGIVAFVMCVLSGKFTAAEGVRYWLDGVKSLVFTLVILISAWTLSSCIGKDGLGAAKFLVSVMSDATPASILPAIIFIFAAIISFATGTSYGTMAIIMPLAIPFANELAPGDYGYLVVASSAVLTGAIFGDHCSPISDTTILSATSARCGLLEHVGTQLSYALILAAIAVVCGFLPVGMGVPVWGAVGASLIAVLAVVFLIGRKTPASLPDDQR